MLMASDIDGTLITSGQRVTERNLEVIEKIKKSGKKFTIATGRPITGVKEYLPLVSKDTPVITYNGGMIIMPDAEGVIYERGLEACSAIELIRMGNELDVVMVLWSKNLLYANKEHKSVEDYSRITGEKVHLLTNPEKVAEEGITKCVWIAPPEKIAEYGKMLESEPVPQTCFCTSTPALLEFMHEEVSKGSGLAKVCEYCGIDVSQVLAAGDERNDISMLRAAGLGIAMGNAGEDVKRAADYVTLTNEESGLAEAMEKFML